MTVMKRLSPSKEQWLIRRQRIACRKAILAARPRVPAKSLPSGTLVAPSYFSIAPSKAVDRSEACTEYLHFIRKIRQFSGRHLHIDMSKVSRMVSQATLLFKAEVAFLKSKGVKVSAVLPDKGRTHQVLTQTGLTDMLGLPACKTDREDTVHWRHASGIWTRTQPDKLANLLVTGEAMTDSALYRGMIESVSNCIEHAYQDHPERRNFGATQDGWWGFQQHRDGRIVTCICDLGIGISRALPIKLTKEPTLYDSLLGMFRMHKGKDIQSILAAVEYGRSSTTLKERGKGLRDAHRVIDDAGEGHLQIISNRGLYFYRREKGSSKPVSGTKPLACSIAGTIYLWSFPLQLQPTTDASSVIGEVK